MTMTTESTNMQRNSHETERTLAALLRRRPLVALAAGTLLALGSFAPPVARAADEGAAETKAAAASQDEGDESALADSLLALKVRTTLLTKLGIDGTRVDVSASGARITLSGEVKERATQELAKEVALAVDGVEEVDNRVQVRAPETPGTPVAGAVSNAEREVADAALETRVKGRLLSELGKYGLKIEVEVADGVASLRGTLPDKGREEIAIETAKGTKGVKDVVDLIDVVKP
jgi:hyperosmotically inducible protein